MPDIAASTATTASIQVGGTFNGVLETVGDRDWIRINLTAGQTVQIDLGGSGFNAVSDTYLRLYSANGTLIAENDDGGSFYNSQLTFTPGTSGTYYIAAGSYNDGRTGNYTVSVQETTSAGGTPTIPIFPTTPSTNYTPAPDAPAGPLDSIMGNTILNDHVVTVYFGRAGENFDGQITGEGFNAYERSRFQYAFDQIEAVADIEFRIVNNPDQADFRLVLDTNEMGYNELGYFYSPGPYFEAGVGVFNGAAFDRQAGGNLEVGGNGATTITHELMHGLGLMHPHDDGAGSAIMAGVTSAFDDYGRGNLNQGIFTAMSYNPGYASDQPTWTDAFGSSSGPMALDIAALQLMYGASDNNGGNSTYGLRWSNGSGTGWETIWDTGGADRIQYTGSNDATIDLRAATLTSSAGGGGYVSSVDGVIGGYTIAARVVIEQGYGGNGDDYIMGNGGRNRLVGSGGDDRIIGNAGGDWIGGGLGDDIVSGGSGNDVVYGHSGDDRVEGGSGNDLLGGQNGDDRLAGGDGDDRLFGQHGDDRLYGDLGADLLTGGTGADIFVFRRESDSGTTAATRDTIADFQIGQDRIDLSYLDGNARRTGDQAFDFVGRVAFDGADGQGDVRAQSARGGVMVMVDLDGDGAADMHIMVNGVAVLQATDFIL
ncbi:M10 family metallopeptidase C-terminal domain-containing protein [Loktanella sp. R86503]|uniref:M10 family metallopeptidase C-terminal domain-containing protein n=1 Tax=Loktanella sp. R86503 TaxID=3093847 RepID=UPI0036DE0DD9